MSTEPDRDDSDVPRPTNEVQLGDEILVDITGWDQMYLNPSRTTLLQRKMPEWASREELPLVQDALLWTLPGWYLEHDVEESRAEREGAHLVVRAVANGFDLTFTRADGTVRHALVRARHGVVLHEIERMVDERG